MPHSTREPSAGASILPYFSHLEQTLRQEEEKVEVEANRSLSEASQKTEQRLSEARADLRKKEAARRKAIADEVIAAAQARLDATLSELEELDAHFLKRKDHAVRFGLGWLLGENPS